ncbi:MAG TPA: thioredoxin [Aquificaceae bacterium]|nr:thioredoxin [Aquificaceae bacterium]
MENLLILILIITFTFILGFSIKIYIKRKVKNLIGTEFPLLKEGIVYFYSPKCRACKAMTDDIRKIEKELKVLKVNILEENNVDITKKFKILGTPTIFIVKNGKITDVIIGTTGYKELKNYFQR